MLTVVTESAARYLKAHNEDTANQNLRLMCPVNVRREDEKGALGNRVSAMYPVVPAATMDVVERLNLIRRVTEQIKANREPQALEYMMETAPVVPPMSMAQTLLVGTPFDPTAWACAPAAAGLAGCHAAPAAVRIQLHVHERAGRAGPAVHCRVTRC